MNTKKNQRLFNSYIFLTTFSRNLIEVFIGIILYKLGFTLTQVIYYYLLVNIFSTIIAIPCTHISKRFSNKLLSTIGILAFLALQFVLNTIKKKMFCVYVVAFLFALYRRAYWISRRYYTMHTIDDKNNISCEYSIISILNQLGVTISSYCGSILLQYFSIKIITVISIVLLFISLVLLYKTNFEQEKNNYKLNLIETIKSTPISSIVNIYGYEMLNVVKFLFPLYLFIYVKDTYTTVGFINLIVSVASLIFTYVYGKLINNEKNFLKLSILLMVVIKVLEVNFTGAALMILSFAEGFASKMYERSFHKEHLALSKEFEYANYNYMYEIIMNISRTVVVAVLFFFFRDIRAMIYVTLLIIISSVFFNFETKPRKTETSVIWKE